MKQEIKKRIEEINSGIVPEGYEKSDFGIFPCDWDEQKEFGDVAYLSKDKFDRTQTTDNPICIELEHIESKTGRKLGNVFGQEQDSVKTYFEPSDILFGKLRPYLCKCYHAKENGVCSTEIWVIKNKKCIDNSFLYQFINSDKFVKDVNCSSFGTKMPRGEWKDVSKNKYAFPKTKAEQSKIAEILMKWDDAIALQEQYIKKLEDRRVATLQRLTRKKDNYVPIKLDSVLKERKEYSVKDNGYIHVTLSKEGVVDKTEQYERDFLVASEEKDYKITFKNDIVYNPANLKFGVICINKYEKPAIFSPIYVTFEVNEKYNVDYIGAVLCSNNFINYIRKYEEGSLYERQAVKPEDFLKGIIYVPERKEQDKIAKIINKIDEEISLQKEKLEKIKLQRKAMQQYLLTGVVRVW